MSSLNKISFSEIFISYFPIAILFLSVFNKLSQRGIVCDWREPDVIRFAHHPLFNTYLDIFNVVKVLQDTISNG